ncbi:hypothetical protein [Candidatus Chloroploca asiatica]|uniref:Uncharacterized protein n=1 Tax=Candidatus Chloroploca asiatica TaxID=1506545 RepID=A0A2H3KMK2_9CHLR|nr:hypothetical protein [Candidatus Chloroploca asiatica]PDV99280.1 hypothetical protein A9Q02_13040 [Candidatus Chloroploca asiatica]
MGTEQQASIVATSAETAGDLVALSDQEHPEEALPEEHGTSAEAEAEAEDEDDEDDDEDDDKDQDDEDEASSDDDDDVND